MIKPVSIEIEECEEGKINMRVRVQHNNGYSERGTTFMTSDGSKIDAISDEVLDMLCDLRKDGTLEHITT